MSEARQNARSFLIFVCSHARLFVRATYTFRRNPSPVLGLRFLSHSTVFTTEACGSLNAMPPACNGANGPRIRTQLTQLVPSSSADPSATLSADCAYDGDALRHDLASRGTTAIVPNKINRVNRFFFDRQA